MIRPTIAAILLFALEPSALQAESIAEPSTENSMSQAASGFVTTIQNAANGDTVAVQQILNNYLAPAAMALILLIIGYLLASFISRIVSNTTSKRIDKTIGRFAGRMTHNTIMVLVLLGALGYFGVDVTSFAAIIAAVGFAIGMALQGTLSNFASGIMLLVFRPFQIDDYIEVSGVSGTVEEIDLFTTKLNTPDNQHVILPNNKIFGETLVNYSRNATRRVDVSVGVAYDADMRTTRRVLEDAVSSIPNILDTPEPQIYLKELGDSALLWQCRVWVATADYWSVRESVTEQIKYALDDANIGIPFPQVDVNVAGKLFAKAA